MYCTHCGAPLSGSVRFCTSCGAKVDRSPTVAPPPAPAPPPPTSEARGTPVRGPRFRFFKVVLLLGVIAVAVALARKYGLIHPKPALGDEPTPVYSGAAAVDVSPAEGVRITAPPNALDRDRTFAVSRIAEDDLAPLASSLGSDVRAVAAFTLESGLKPTEEFPGPVTVRLDLRTLQVPDALWPLLRVVRIEADGARTQLDPSVNAGALVVATRRNSTLVVIVPLLTLGTPIVAKLLTEKYEKFNFLGATRYTDHIPHYALYWSGDLGVRDATAVRRVNDILHTKYRQYGLERADGTPIMLSGTACISAYNAVAADPEYAAAHKLAMDVEWKLAHLYPARVATAVRGLLKGDEYLFDVRKFTRPEHAVDVLALSPWPAADGFSPTDLGLALDPPFQDSWLAVNVSDDIFGSNRDRVTPKGNVIPAKPKSAAELTTIEDGMNITIVHELFHVLQDTYVTVRRNKYLWFFEATAVTLEVEANAHYAKSGWNTSGDIETDRDAWETLRAPLPDDGSEAGDVRKHGYTLSHFLEYLRDDASFNHGKDYVKDATVAFGGFFATPVSALYSGAGSSSAELGERFLAFVREPGRAALMHRNVMEKVADPKKRAAGDWLFADIDVPLNVTRAVHQWKYQQFRPLTVEYRAYQFSTVPARQMKDAVAYVLSPLAGAFAYYGVYHDIKTGSAPFKPVTAGVVEVRGSPLPAFTVKRIDSNAARAWTSFPDEALTIILMLRPEEPGAEYDEEQQVLDVTIPQSSLRKQLPDDTRLSHELSAMWPGRTTPVTIALPASDRNVRLDLKTETKSGGRLFGMTNVRELEVWYVQVVERVAGGASVRGPESDKVHPRGPTDASWVGRWEYTHRASMGQTWFEIDTGTATEVYEISPYGKDGMDFIAKHTSTVVLSHLRDSHSRTYYLKLTYNPKRVERYYRSEVHGGYIQRWGLQINSSGEMEEIDDRDFVSKAKFHKGGAAAPP